MSSCTVKNSTDITCDYGCCGTEANRTCCEFTLSESVLIVICVVGALVVVAIVVALIICLTSKQKNRVTQIGPRERRIMRGDLEPRRRRVGIPKPPPYSEAPPQYDSLHFNDDSRSNPRSTDPILPGHIRTNVQGARRQRSDRRQNPSAEEQSISRFEPRDAPPSYISIIQVESRENENRRTYTPEAGTSGLGNNGGSSLSNNYGATPLFVTGQNRQSSPHPSLASGRISTSMYNGAVENRTFHRTASERSHQLSSHITVSRHHGMNNNSVSPVTIREITVHSHVIRNNQSTETSKSKGGKTKGTNIHTKIPRPIKPNGPTQIDNNLNVGSSVNTGLGPDALDDANDLLRLGESPPPINQSAAARSAKRRTVIQKLQQRKQTSSLTPVE
ncbi:uncharacterized protein LOC132729724 [Ruditapes philippinarum]|uniref:uncharacterized protein LOC132729724 n=1 Tax=Ruditapes philippinarum TaxID=129788 RepID=UPI00295AE1B1|nr:uncharacterized protein LOC132729724 [Ruditapes philippinarum]